MASNGRERGEFAIFIFDLVEHRMKFEDEFEQITSTRGEIKRYSLLKINLDENG